MSKTKLTMKQAIRAKCRDCIYDDEAIGMGGELQQISDCPSEDTCALWEHRAVTGKEKTRRKQAAFDAMSPDEQAESIRIHDERSKAFKERMHK